MGQCKLNSLESQRVTEEADKRALKITKYSVISLYNHRNNTNFYRDSTIYYHIKSFLAHMSDVSVKVP